MAQAPGSSRQGAQQGGRRGKGEPPDDLEFVDALIHTPQALEVEERGGGSPGGGGGGELPKPNHLVPAAWIEAPKRRERRCFTGASLAACPCPKRTPPHLRGAERRGWRAIRWASARSEGPISTGIRALSVCFAFQAYSSTWLRP